MGKHHQQFEPLSDAIVKAWVVDIPQYNKRRCKLLKQATSHDPSEVIGRAFQAMLEEQLLAMFIRVPR